MEMKFVADSMLGRLAKWMRVMGYDTLYQTYYASEALQNLVMEGRTLLSRNKKAIAECPGAFFIESDHVGDQLAALKKAGLIRRDRSRWFIRCLECNSLLRDAEAESARENVPEYVYYSNVRIRYCPGCSRYFWAGTHRERMRIQLGKWGF